MISRAEYFLQSFGKQEAIDDFVKLHLEGELAAQGKSWEDIWMELAPESLKSFPLPAGGI